MERSEKIPGVEGAEPRPLGFGRATGTGGADSGSQLRILGSRRTTFLKLPAGNTRSPESDLRRTSGRDRSPESFLPAAGMPKIDNRFPGSAPKSGQTPESSLAVIVNLPCGCPRTWRRNSGQCRKWLLGDRTAGRQNRECRRLGDTSSATPAVVIFFPFRRCASSCVNTICRGGITSLRSLARALLNNLDEVVRWAQTADKMEIAMLAPVVFEAAASGDARMTEIIENGAPGSERIHRRQSLPGLHLLAPKVMLLGGLFHRD